MHCTCEKELFCLTILTEIKKAKHFLLFYTDQALAK
jgi:hypothetical protein